MPHTHAHAIGDQVRVIDGPLADHQATVRAVDRDRLRLDVAVARMIVPITVEPHQVEPVA